MVRFTFQIDEMSAEWRLYLKLRSNLALDSDLQLARLEVTKILGDEPTSLTLKDFEGLVSDGILAQSDIELRRLGSVIGYKVVKDGVIRGRALFEKPALLELIVGESSTSSATEGENRLREVLDGVPAHFYKIESVYPRARFRLVPLYAVAEWSSVIASRSTDLQDAIRTLEHLLSVVLCGKVVGNDHFAWKIIVSPQTSNHSFHGLHVYKAKFFPRMARALINAYAAHARKENFRVFDPFVGSGTALLESSMLGLESYGVDADPLSSFIALTKVECLHQASPIVAEMLNRASEMLSEHRQPSLFGNLSNEARDLTLPDFLKGRISTSLFEEIATDFAIAQSALKALNGLPLKIAQVALSDAITRKVRFRFLGLGYGRFSLEVSQRSIVRTFASNLRHTARVLSLWHWLLNKASLQPAQSHVQTGDARFLPFADSAFDLVLTSPPYLPASSGRENYLKSKSLALLSLGLTRAIDRFDRLQIGSAHQSTAWSALPPIARELVAWMSSDPVRKVKANATAAYFQDLSRALSEIRRVLQPGGVCLLVVARQHTFYRYQSRDIVKVFDNALATSEVAQEAGFEVEDLIHLELDKQTTVARPRAQDKYYETVLVLRNSRT